MRLSKYIAKKLEKMIYSHPKLRTRLMFSHKEWGGLFDVPIQVVIDSFEHYLEEGWSNFESEIHRHIQDD